MFCSTATIDGKRKVVVDENTQFVIISSFKILVRV